MGFFLNKHYTFLLDVNPKLEGGKPPLHAHLWSTLTASKPRGKLAPPSIALSGGPYFTLVVMVLYSIFVEADLISSGAVYDL